ncbi:MAG: Tat pathway signal sequence domain protein, partial [Phycisphaerales bacterium]|nr:Tat pathway signal sequence domain protein [Phycisphaerales bacterium]
MAELTRREILQGAIAAGVTLTAASAARSQTRQAVAPAKTIDPTKTAEAAWLDTKSTEAAAVGVTWGVPWARGLLKETEPLRVESDTGTAIPSQAWPTAFWPDGSVKWSAVAVGPQAAGAASLRVSPGEAAKGATVRALQANDTSIAIDTGLIQCTIATGGQTLIPSVRRNGKETLIDGRLVALRLSAPGESLAARPAADIFSGQVDQAVIEQAGPIRAVIKLTGKHQRIDKADATGGWLPFVVRLYFYAGSDVIRVMHSFIFDGDEKKDFISGLGLSFNVPIRDPLYDRHVRLVGQDDGLFGEAVRGITGLRRDPGDAVRKAQIDGTATPPLAEWAPSVSKALDLIPSWADFTLSQLCADGFQIRKRTKSGCAWIPAGAGKRAAGVGYIGGITGGVSFGLRDFWEKHPTQLDVRGATSDKASVNIWLWSPEAQPMDLRTYHDVMGMETYDQQRAGLDITYEDYEPGYDTPYGVARTSEMFLRI